MSHIHGCREKPGGFSNLISDEEHSPCQEGREKNPTTYPPKMGIKKTCLFFIPKPSHKVTVADLHTVLYVDCTKLGVLTQQQINQIGALSEKVLGLHPTRSLVKE